MCTWDSSLSQKRNWKGSILNKHIQKRKNPTSLHRSKKDKWHSSSAKAETNLMGKNRHLSSLTHFLTPKVGRDLPISATVFAIKTNHFSSPYFFSPPLPKGIIFDNYWQANVLHAVIPCNRMHCLFIHACSCLVCHQYLRFLLLPAEQYKNLFLLTFKKHMQSTRKFLICSCISVYMLLCFFQIKKKLKNSCSSWDNQFSRSYYRLMSQWFIQLQQVNNRQKIVSS